jgi:hypothetical protein
MRNKLVIGLLLSIGLVISAYAAQRMVIAEFPYGNA